MDNDFIKMIALGILLFLAGVMANLQRETINNLKQQTQILTHIDQKLKILTIKGP